MATRTNYLQPTLTASLQGSDLACLKCFKQCTQLNYSYDLRVDVQRLASSICGHTLTTHHQSALVVRFVSCPTVPD